MNIKVNQNVEIFLFRKLYINAFQICIFILRNISQKICYYIIQVFIPTPSLPLISNVIVLFCNIIIIALLTYQFNVRQYCSSIKMNLFLGVQTHMKTKVMSNVVTLYGILTRLQ